MTGASGFLGRHLLEAIESTGSPQPPIALVRNREAWHALEWTRALPRVRTLEGSVTAAAAWANDSALEGLRGIFHLAALVRHNRRDAAEVLQTNVEGTLGVVRVAAAHRCRMVFVSTSGTVGCFTEPGPSADEEAPYCEQTVGGWPYYRSKIEAERQARRLAGELGVELVIVRPPVLLGPGDHRLRSSGYVLRLLRGKLPFLIRGGMHFADVRDVARALLSAMQRPEVRQIYHLPGTICSIEEFYGQVARLSGRRPPRVVLPFRPAWLLAVLAERLGVSALPEPALIEMASHHWAAHSLHAPKELDYRCRAGNETLADTITWLQVNHPELA